MSLLNRRSFLRAPSRRRHDHHCRHQVVRQSARRQRHDPDRRRRPQRPGRRTRQAIRRHEGRAESLTHRPRHEDWARRVSEVEKTGSGTPKTVQDVRKPSKTRTSTPSPSPRRPLALPDEIWAASAGKMSMSRSPAATNVHEGRIAVETARKHERIVQHGTQSRAARTSSVWEALVRSGKARQAPVSRALCYKLRPDRREGTHGPAERIGFQLWLGPHKATIPYQSGAL